MTQQLTDIQLAAVQEAQRAHETSLLKRAHVVGVGVGFKEVKGKETSEACVHVYVEKKVDKKDLSPDALVPAALDGVKTDVKEVGRIEAQTFNARVRPAIPGYSIGHFRITAGTLGCLVRDVCPPCRTYILSNNHVLANSNAAGIGDPILQPGPYDGGAYPGDVIARLARFVPIRFNNPDNYNLVDAALAEPLDPRNVAPAIVGRGIPKGTVEAVLGMEVAKSGRTTQATTGRVIGIAATVAVGYGTAGVAYFRDQILTTNMSQGGDSGSLLVSRSDQHATGLLFAGSSVVTVHNNIRNVLLALGVEIVTP